MSKTFFSCVKYFKLKRKLINYNQKVSQMQCLSARKASGRLVKFNIMQLIVSEVWICMDVKMHFSILDIMKFNIL